MMKRTRVTYFVMNASNWVCQLDSMKYDSHRHKSQVSELKRKIN